MCVLAGHWRLWYGVTRARAQKNLQEDFNMGLNKLAGWAKMHAAPATACDAADKPAACGAADKPTACGAADKPAACGTACGAPDKK